jgi:hypothetical protein
LNARIDDPTGEHGSDVLIRLSTSNPLTTKNSDATTYKQARAQSNPQFSPVPLNSGKIQAPWKIVRRTDCTYHRCISKDVSVAVGKRSVGELMTRPFVAITEWIVIRPLNLEWIDRPVESSMIYNGKMVQLQS